MGYSIFAMTEAVIFVLRTDNMSSSSIRNIDSGESAFTVLTLDTSRPQTRDGDGLVPGASSIVETEPTEADHSTRLRRPKVRPKLRGDGSVMHVDDGDENKHESGIVSATDESLGLEHTARIVEV